MTEGELGANRHRDGKKFACGFGLITVVGRAVFKVKLH